LEILPLDHKRQLALGAFARTPALEGRGRAERRVEGQVLRPPDHRAGTDVTAAFAFGQRETALAGRLACEFVQGCVKPFGLKVGADLDLAARLRAGVGRLGLSRVLFLRLAASRCIGWFC
jgi:hypothetical protein